LQFDLLFLFLWSHLYLLDDIFVINSYIHRHYRHYKLEFLFLMAIFLAINYKYLISSHLYSSWRVLLTHLCFFVLSMNCAAVLASVAPLLSPAPPPEDPGCFAPLGALQSSECSLGVDEVAKLIFVKWKVVHVAQNILNIPIFLCEWRPVNESGGHIQQLSRRSASKSSHRGFHG
jgi:hypothetical protein